MPRKKRINGDKGVAMLISLLFYNFAYCPAAIITDNGNKVNTCGQGRNINTHFVCIAIFADEHLAYGIGDGNTGYIAAGNYYYIMCGIGINAYWPL